MRATAGLNMVTILSTSALWVKTVGGSTVAPVGPQQRMGRAATLGFPVALIRTIRVETTGALLGDGAGVMTIAVPQIFLIVESESSSYNLKCQLFDDSYEKKKIID